MTTAEDEEFERFAIRVAMATSDLSIGFCWVVGSRRA